MAELLPAALYALCELTIDDQQAWNEALILEKLGFNWATDTAYGSSGVKSIVFTNPYAAGVTDIDVRVKAFNALGEDIGAAVKSGTLTNLGFDVYVGEACDFSYISFEPKVLIP